MIASIALTATAWAGLGLAAYRSVRAMATEARLAAQLGVDR